MRILENRQMSHSHSHSHAHSHEGHVCGGAGIEVPTAQSLDELAFERGLWPAAMMGDCSKLERLLATHSADERDSSGLTALHYAARANQLAALKVLLAAGASVDAASRTGATPLHRAAAAGHQRIAEHLLAAGANATLADSREHTPATLARKSGHEALACLLEKTQSD